MQTRPATVEEAARATGLESFPALEGARFSGARRVAGFAYVIKSGVKPAYDALRQQLLAQQWKELPGGYITDQAASGTFQKNGFRASVSVFPPGGSEAPGSVNVTFLNHGNVDPGALPVPPGAKPLFALPVMVSYVTEKPVAETAAACRKLLTDQGWQPYGRAGDVQFFKQNAVRLTARVLSAPGQGGRTVIDYSTEQLSADLPTTPQFLDAQYADSNKQLLFDTAGTVADVVKFYRETLAPAAWKSTTESAYQIDFKHTLVFRNPQHDMLELEMYPVEGKLRVTLKHLTAAEVADLKRLADRAEAERKKQASRPLPRLVLALSTGAQEVEQSKSRIEFKVAAGTSKTAVAALRTQLGQAGWKEQTAIVEPMAGHIEFEKGKATVSITYVDPGIIPAEITISTFGAALERTEASGK